MISKSEKSRIQAMIQSLTKIPGGDPSTPLDVSSSDDELDQLARTINTLLQTGKKSKSDENEKHYLQILDRIQESCFEMDLAGKVKRMLAAK